MRQNGDLLCAGTPVDNYLEPTLAVFAPGSKEAAVARMPSA
jgi:hypothetical protein